MTTPNTRKPLRIVNDDSAGEERPWKVRTESGQVRGPLTIAGVRSLLEMGIVTGAASIAAADGDSWVRISEHPVWKEIQPSTKPFSFRNAELVEEPITPHVSPGDVAVRPERLERMQAIQQAELDRRARGITYWQVGKGLRAVRELLVFLAFLTFGDFATSFFDHSLGLVKVGVLLFLSAVALMYYTFRAMEK